MTEFAKLVGREVVPTNRFESQTPKERCVARLEIQSPSGTVIISTIFLSINHGWNDDEFWFETMVFGGPRDGDMDRYRTYDSAEYGHEKMVKKVRKALEET